MSEVAIALSIAALPIARTVELLRKKFSVNYIEGELADNSGRWIQWGMCIANNGDRRYDFPYWYIKLPSWYWDIDPLTRRYALFQRTLFSFNHRLRVAMFYG